MEAVAIVTVLALVQYSYFGVEVGTVRGRKGIKAPAQSGDVEFERMNRVHLNTLEQLAVLLPAMWMFAYFVNPLWAAGAGVVYVIGRQIYRSAYLKDPGSRTIGFMMSYLPSIVMLIWVLIKTVLSYV